MNGRKNNADTGETKTTVLGERSSSGAKGGVYTDNGGSRLKYARTVEVFPGTFGGFVDGSLTREEGIGLSDRGESSSHRPVSPFRLAGAMC